MTENPVLNGMREHVTMEQGAQGTMGFVRGEDPKRKGLIIQPGGGTMARLQAFRAELGNKKAADPNYGRTGSPQAQESSAEEDGTPVQGKRRKPRKTAAEVAVEQKSPPPPPHRDVAVSVAVEGFGTIPSQYHHMYIGDACIVLGMTSLSYEPKVATAQVSLGPCPGRLFLNSGYSFVDADGVRNIILIEVPNGQTE